MSAVVQGHTHSNLQVHESLFSLIWPGCKGITIARLAKKEDHDAQDTVKRVEAEGGQCLDLIADVSDPEV